MTLYEITYKCTGSGQNGRLDRVTITEGEEFEFETGIEKVTNITDAIEIFEVIAAKWWGTYETRNAIVNINVKAA